MLVPENQAKWTREAVEGSLKLLHTNYLDLVLIHYPRPLEFSDDDPNNAIRRKEAYLELEKLNSERHGLDHSCSRLGSSWGYPPWRSDRTSTG